MKDILNPWTIAGAILTASVLLLISFFASGSIFQVSQSSYAGDAVITVIPLPTYTNTPLPPEPTITPASETSVGIQIGANVQIFGTEGEGLRLRREPSLNGEIVYLGLEGEIFLVRAGPEDRDGYIWWQLTAPLNDSRTGWAVSNFLQPVQGQ